MNLIDPHRAWEGAPNPPRRWQAECFERIVAADAAGTLNGSVVHAVMGSGKSRLIAEVTRAAMGRGRVVISTPSIALVEQIHETLRERGMRYPGRYYTHRSEATSRIIVACTQSLPALAAELEGMKLATDLWIADECHRTERETVREWIDRGKPRVRLGFSATPFRAAKFDRNGDDGPDAPRFRALSAWTESLYSYTIDDAIREGVLVPYRVHLPMGEPGDVVEVDDVCAEFAEGAEGPGVVSAESIADAEAYAAFLRERGGTAGVIHSKISRSAQTAVIEALRGGQIHTLVHCAMLVEGVDLPWLRWLAVRRKRNAVGFAQEVGRVLRAAPGKLWADVFDPHQLFATHGISNPAALSAALDVRDDEPERKPAKEREPGESDDVVLAKLSALVSGSSPLGVWCYRAADALRVAGVAQGIAAGKWRDGLASRAQRETLARAVSDQWVKGDGPVASSLRLAVITAAAAPDVTGGMASDILTILTSRRRDGFREALERYGLTAGHEASERKAATIARNAAFAALREGVQ